MSPRYRGSTPIVGRYRGSTPILQRYRGSDLVWSSFAGIKDDFTRLDGDGNPVDVLNSLGPNWTDHGPSNDYKLGVEDGMVRCNVPDADLSLFWSLRTSRWRYNVAKNLTEDGYVECRFSSRGSGASLTSLGGFITQVIGRTKDDAASNGAMIEAAAGHLWIATQNGLTGTRRRDCGTFQAGDVARLVFAGNVHTMYVNGAQRSTPWTRTGSEYLVGAGYRSLAVRGDGGKDVLGPRRFSPALDYVAMG